MEKIDIDFTLVVFAALVIWFWPMEDGSSLARSVIHHITDGEVPAYAPEEDDDENP